MAKKNRRRKQSGKPIKHYHSVVRSDEMDLDPTTKYRDIKWQIDHDHQDYAALNNEFKHDAIARKIVSKPAEDATRNNWRLVIPDDPALQEQYQQALDKLKLQDVLTKQIIYQRLHGDGYITIGVKENDPTDNATPLDPANLKDVAFVHAFGQTNIQAYRTNNDPTSVDYGKESAIVVTPTQAGSTIDRYGNQVANTENLQPIVIDSSRYFHISLDKFEDDLTGTSVLTRCHGQIKAMDIALETAGKMMREYTFKVINSDKLMNEDTNEFRKDRDKMVGVMNTESTVFLGGSDTISKVSTPVSGIDTLYNFAWQQLSAACNIPKSVLTGEQSGTLAGASQDIVNYYDSVKSIQEQILKPELERIVKLLMYATDVADGSIDPDSVNWHIEFNPLWSPDDKTQSETLLNSANAASTLVSAGIYSPDEARQMLDSQGNNAIQGMQSIETDSFTQDEIDQYKHDAKDAEHYGKKA